MDQRRRENNNKPRNREFKIERKKGNVWFGNPYFHFYNNSDIIDPKEPEVKKKFFMDVFNQFNSKVENFALLINKFIPIFDIELMEYGERENRKKLFSLKEKCLEETTKKDFFCNVIEKYYFAKQDYTDKKYNSQIECIKNALISEKNEGKENYKLVFDKNIPNISPLICGFGSTHVLETSLTLHHIWGVPYIPASSLKGVCREVAFWKLVEKRNLQNESQINELQNQFYGNLFYNNDEILKYQLLFGAQDFKGLLIFLDVLPDASNNKGKLFKLDIMNPHYSSYYSDDSGKTAPGDWDNPIPILFLTVREGINFKFIVLFDNYRWNRIKENGLYIINEKGDKLKVNIPYDKVEELIDDNNFFNQILKDTLDTYGVGSKTRLGYGSFKIQS
ncbi:MAG: type III-B CRISPR module RAMP protein Cmr6 [Spirochaetota bacterium]